MRDSCLGRGAFVYGDSKKIYKNKLLVEVEFDSGVVWTGYLFVGQQQRLSDLMNDERIFLPFEMLDGAIEIFVKARSRRVKPIARVNAASDSENPFHVFGLSDTASEATLRETYHRKVQEMHPDKLASLGLSEELVRFAHERMARLNEAYSRARKLCREAPGAAAAAE